MESSVLARKAGTESLLERPENRKIQFFGLEILLMMAVEESGNKLFHNRFETTGIGVNLRIQFYIL